MNRRCGRACALLQGHLHYPDWVNKYDPLARMMILVWWPERTTLNTRSHAS